MSLDSLDLHLQHAPQNDGGRAYKRLFDFLSGVYSPNVSIRPEEVVKAAIAEQNLFFLENRQEELVGTTGFYQHGVFPNLWGEIGTTLIHPVYRGFGLQRIIYQYVLVHQWLASPSPRPVIAVVDASAAESSANIERTGFRKIQNAPDELVEAKPDYDWRGIERGKKHLYQLTKAGLVSALNEVARAGAAQQLMNKRTGSAPSRSHFILLIYAEVAF